MPPRVPGLGEAVAHYNERPIAGLGNVHLDAVRAHQSVPNLHAPLPAPHPAACPAPSLSLNGCERYRLDAPTQSGVLLVPASTRESVSVTTCGDFAPRPV